MGSRPLKKEEKNVSNDNFIHYKSNLGALLFCFWSLKSERSRSHTEINLLSLVRIVHGDYQTFCHHIATKGGLQG